VDGQIAAIAFTQNLTLVTRNRKHFDLFEGLHVVDWGS
jgi:predicted nucleic acid-binding protein